MNIAISGVGKRVQLIRMALQALVEDQIFCMDSSKDAPALLEGNNFYVLPKATDDTFTEQVKLIAEQFQIDLWLSIIDTETIPLSTMQDIHTQFVVPDNVEPCVDKYETALMCNLLNLSTPVTSLAPLTAFPQIVKDRFGSASSGYNFIPDYKALKYINPGSNIIYQEYISGTHLDVDFYVDMVDGDIKSIVTREVLQRKAGETYLARFVEPMPEMESILSKVSSYLGLKGPNNADFIYRDGSAYLLDLNPRFGGNYPGTYAIGHDYWSALKHNFGGKPVAVMHSQPANRIMKKYFYIEVS